MPEEVAVLSGSNDELLCDVLFMPISGAQTPGEQIGHDEPPADYTTNIISQESFDRRE